MFFHFCLDTKTKQKSQALDFQRSNWFLNLKINELAPLKHHLFLRILQIFDARLQILGQKIIMVHYSVCFGLRGGCLENGLVINLRFGNF